MSVTCEQRVRCGEPWVSRANHHRTLKTANLSCVLLCVLPHRFFRVYIGIRVESWFSVNWSSSKLIIENTNIYSVTIGRDAFHLTKNSGLLFGKFPVENRIAFPCALQKFTKIYYREFLFHLICISIIGWMVQTLVLGFSRTFPRKFPYHLPLSQKVRNFGLNGKRY